MQEAMIELVRLSSQAPGYIQYGLALLGLAIILAGWRGYRLWFSMLITSLAGMWGLVYGNQYGVSPLVAGLLAALGAGSVSLAMTRLIIFGVGGWLAGQLARLVFQEWANPLICFFAGGLLSVLLFKSVVRLVTGGIGVLLLSLGARWVKIEDDVLVLSEWWRKLGLDSVAWAWLLGTFVAAFVQWVFDKGIDWWRARREAAKKKASEKKEVVAQAA
ncbi:MAG: hypothetical protein RMI91_14855 [Gemmatales bacterium]|nr:hypothetical protein [Gemmatales bacterium]MDW7995924.1 hypothetical protein [Gemmatales bacterium]